MSPILFIKEMERHIEMTFNRVVRVHWMDNLFFQINEGTREEPEWTGYDFLVGGQVTHSGKVHLSACLDMGGEGLPIMLLLDEEDDDPRTTTIYNELKSKFLHRPPDETLVKMLMNLRMDMKLHSENYFPHDPHQDRLAEVPSSPTGADERPETDPERAGEASGR
jgi:hypothetical protein